MKTNLLFVFFLILISFTFVSVSAISFGYNNPNIPQLTNANSCTCISNGSSGNGTLETHFGTFNQTDGIYLYNSTGSLINFNETKLNDTIDKRDGEPLWNANYSLGWYRDWNSTGLIINWSDAISGDNSSWNQTFANTLYYFNSNPFNFWNSTFATFNKTYADILYYGISNPYNFTNKTNLSGFIDDVFGNSTLARTGNCSAGYAVQNTTTSGVQCITMPVTTIGGSDTYVQFNDNGVFNGTSDLIFNKTSKSLGIGGVPTHSLDVFTTANSGAAFKRIGTGELHFSNLPASNSIRSFTSGAGGYKDFTFEVSATIPFILKAITARFGLGTSAPSALEEISSDTTEQLRLSYNSTKYTSFTTDSSGNLNINGSSNKVGINNSSPTSALDVGGTITSTMLNVTRNATASYFFGNGSQLTGIVQDNSSWNQSFANTLYYGISNPYNYWNTTYYGGIGNYSAENSTIVRVGSYNCSSGQVLQNVTANSSGIFGQCVVQSSSSSSGFNTTSGGYVYNDTATDITFNTTNVCLLGGKAGGQNITGGSNSGDNLTLTDNSIGNGGIIINSSNLNPANDATTDLGKLGGSNQKWFNSLGLSAYIYFRSQNGTNYTRFITPLSQNGNQSYTLPDSYPSSNGQALTSTTGGEMSWSSTIIPSGMLSPFYLSACPTGWVMANGTNYSGTLTPDLRDRFIIASGSIYAFNTTGGSTTYIPAGGIDSHTGFTIKQGTVVDPKVYFTGPLTHLFTGTPATIIPPYYSTIWCMKT